MNTPPTGMTTIERSVVKVLTGLKLVMGNEIGYLVNKGPAMKAEKEFCPGPTTNGRAIRKLK
jgi:hypothetical protein